MAGLINFTLSETDPVRLPSQRTTLKKRSEVLHEECWNVYRQHATVD